jgi:6-phosphofructokinase 1
MRIGILNGGGDCPGLNAVTHGVVCAARHLDWEVVGFRDGFEGMLPPGDYFMLDRGLTNGIMGLGGTILGTANQGSFSSKVGSGELATIDPELIEKCRMTLQGREIEALIVVGGDGTLSTGLQLYRGGIPVIGVPKTIDNDLSATAMTFGFDSATTLVVDALDRLRTTAQSHKRVMVVEVMGRHAGWIAIYGGLGGGADVILLPEIPFDYDVVAEHIKERDAQGHHSSMVVVSEGAKPKDGELVGSARKGRGEMRLGGIGEIVARELGERTGKEARACVLGHLQRGGAPTSLDRVLATRFGVKAVALAKEKKFGEMVSYQSYQVGSVPLEAAVEKLKTVPTDCELVETARQLWICLGDR